MAAIEAIEEGLRGMPGRHIPGRHIPGRHIPGRHTPLHGEVQSAVMHDEE